MGAGGLGMHLYGLMCVDEIIDEANAKWEVLKRKYPFLDGYHDCGDFFERLADAPVEERETILFRIWDGCHGRFTQGDTALMILLCYREFREVLKWKVKAFPHDEDKIQIFQMMIDIFLTRIAARKTPIIKLRNFMNSELENFRRQLKKEISLFSPIEFFENSGAIGAAALPDLMNSPEELEVWNLILYCIPNQGQIDWLKALVALNAHIPGFEESVHAPKLSNKVKCEIRDRIADVVKSKIPRLGRFVKKRQKGKRRRNYAKTT